MIDKIHPVNSVNPVPLFRDCSNLNSSRTRIAAQRVELFVADVGRVKAAVVARVTEVPAMPSDFPRAHNRRLELFCFVLLCLFVAIMSARR